MNRALRTAIVAWLAKLRDRAIVVLAERVGPARVDADDPDRPAGVDERRRDHRADAQPPDELVRALGVDEARRRRGSRR